MERDQEGGKGGAWKEKEEQGKTWKMIYMRDLHISINHVIFTNKFLVVLFWQVCLVNVIFVFLKKTINMQNKRINLMPSIPLKINIWSLK
jgi:hypothetical protein